MNKDITNITKGVLLILAGIFLGEARYNKEEMEIMEILLNALPVLLIVAGLHFLGKSLAYHLKCFQIKYRREIREKLERKKTN